MLESLTAMKDSVVNFLTVLVVVIGVIVWLQKNEKPAQAQQPLQQQQPYQRFVPIPRESGLVGVPWSGSLALDTKTGQLCKTYANIGAKWDSLPACSYLALDAEGYKNQTNPFR